MANDLNRSIKIYIDGSQATDNIVKIENAVQRLESKLANLSTTEADYEKKSKELKYEISAKNRTLETYRKKVEETERVLKNLSGATYKELLAVQKQVRQDLQNAVPGTEKYNAALEQNRRVSQQVAAAQKAMRAEVGAQGSVWLRASNFINQYIGIIGTVVAAVTGLTLKLNQLREARNKREEAKADVQALTGLDEESIGWLEQQAKQMSTTMDQAGIRIRQSATEILDAYKLVGSAKPELLQDKEALNAVTQQTLILAQASGMTLKDAVDATTLSLNQFGAGADQASRYVNVMAAGSKYGSAAVESVTKALRNSGVAAASANISIEQTVGMIETLAEKGIKDEVAGTGLKKFFLTLQTGADETNPKIVGLETALDNLAAKQLNAAQIKQMFGEEGYNVASVLIDETEKVKYYTQAVTGTGVAIEQAGIKSQTAAAKLAQAKNRMQEMGIELMEKLNPGLVSAANGIVNWTQKGVKLVDFLVLHSGVLTTLTASIVAYYTGVKLATLYETRLKNAKLASIAVDKIQAVWNKTLLSGTLLLSAAKYALTGNIKLATAAWQRFSAQMAKNPLGLILTIITAVGVGLYQLATRSNQATESLGRMNGELISEQHTLSSLFDALKRTTEGTQQRRDIIKEINDKYGTYLPNLLTEKSSLDEINAAYKRINETLVTQLALKYKNEEIGNITSEAAKEQVEDIEGMRSALARSMGSDGMANIALNEIKELTNEYYNVGVRWEKAYGSIWTTIRDKYLGKNSISEGYYEDMANYIKSVYKMNNELAKVERKYANWMPVTKKNELGEVVVTGNKPDSTPATTPTDTKPGKDKEVTLLTPEESAAAELERQLAIEKELYQRHQLELKELFASGQDENLQSEADYNEALEQLTIQHLERMMDIAGLDSEQQMRIEEQLLDFKVKCQKELLEETKKNQALQQQSEEEAARKAQETNRKKFETMRGYAEQFGSALGSVISGQENAMQTLGDTMIDIVFDYLEKLVDAWLVELAGKAVKETASAQMTEIGSKGLFGLGTGAMLAVTISGLLAAAKAGLKGLINNSRSSDSSSGNTSSNGSTYNRVAVNQHAAGRYDVIGAVDGKNYRGVPYIGEAPTGIVSSPALISEKGAELIVNADDLRRLQKHINYPLVVQAINESRGRVVQHSSGIYRIPDTPQPTRPTPVNWPEANGLLERLASALEMLENNGISASVSLTEFEKKQRLRNRSRKIGSK